MIEEKIKQNQIGQGGNYENSTKIEPRFSEVVHTIKTSSEDGSIISSCIEGPFHTYVVIPENKYSPRF